MPQIIVAADRGAAFGEGAVTFRERVNVTDFESEHFAAQLVERLGWAVEDADAVERRHEEPSDRRTEVDSRREERVDEAEPVGETQPTGETESTAETESIAEAESVGIPLEESAPIHAPA